MACQKASEVARLVNDRSGGCLDLDTHGFADNKSKRRFAQSGRTREQDMVKGLFALFGRLHREEQAIPDFMLSDKVIKARRAEAIVKRGIALVEGLCGVGLHRGQAEASA
jgi:hypothetical protein